MGVQGWTVRINDAGEVVMRVLVHEHRSYDAPKIVERDATAGDLVELGRMRLLGHDKSGELEQRLAGLEQRVEDMRSNGEARDMFNSQNFR